MGTIRNTDEIVQALREGNLSDVRSMVSSLLDGIGHPDLDETLDDVALRVPEMVDGLYGIIEERAQSFAEAGRETSLFCIPFIMDSDDVGPMPAELFHGMLSDMSGPDEEVKLLSGWIHINDLMALSPRSYRRLLKWMAGSDDGPSFLKAVPNVLLPNSPVPSGDNAGGATILSWDAANRSRTVTTISPRLLVGAVSGPSGGVEGLRTTVSGSRPEKTILRLSRDMASAMEGVLMISDIGPPIHAAVGTAGAVALGVLGARMDAWTASRGRRPIIHYCVDMNDVVFAMSTDDEEDVERVVVCGLGSDHGHLLEMVFSKGAAIVAHETMDDLPREIARTRH